MTTEIRELIHMQSNNGRFDLIVVGGGVAGLATAAFAARTGKRVIVLEQSQEIGGRARTREQDGYLLNFGPHALYRGGRGIEVLEELGVAVHGKMPSVSGAFAVKGGVKHTFPAGFVSLLTTSLFGPAAKFETARLLAALSKIDAGAVANVSLRDWVDSNISHEAVREFLLTTFRIATYTNAPELLSAGTAIAQLQKAFEKNVLYLDGGWQSIVDGLRKAAVDAGVAIEPGARVEAVERESSGSVSGVRLADGKRFQANQVVIAAGPAIAASLIEGGAPESLRKWADGAIPVRAACFDVALQYLPNPRSPYAFGVDQPLYLSVHSVSARLAPGGGALIHVAKYLSPDNRQQAAEVETELEHFLDLVQQGWKDALVYRRFLPDMIVMHALAEARTGGIAGRPRPRVEEVPGLYVVGDWVGNEGLLVDASLASAQRAAEMIADDTARAMARAS
jgi:phytoene dehydrogenase-like protein